MRSRLGAILCLLLGSVLIWSGLSATSSGNVGSVAFCEPNVGVTALCPTGTITFTEVTDLSAAPGTTPPATWTVRVTSSNCSSPDDSVVNEVVTVNDNGTASTGDLFVYGDPAHNVACQYLYVEDPVASYTTTYDPDSPQPIPFDQSQSNSNLPVTVTNTAAAQSTSPSSVPPTSPTKSGTHTHTSTPTHSASSSKAPTVAVSTPASSSVAPILASTGPRRSIGASLYVGIALCLLGFVLLLAGRRPSQARHRG